MPSPAQALLPSKLSPGARQPQLTRPTPGVGPQPQPALRIPGHAVTIPSCMLIEWVRAAGQSCLLSLIWQRWEWVWPGWGPRLLLSPEDYGPHTLSFCFEWFLLWWRESSLPLYFPRASEMACPTTGARQLSQPQNCTPHPG